MSDDAQIERAAAMAAAWWTERLQQGDREAFRAFLLDHVRRELRDAGECRLRCDYDPLGPLLDAVHAAGVECMGMMFSAKGILPTKRLLVVTPTELHAKEGYGNWTDAIPVPTEGT